MISLILFLMGSAQASTMLTSFSESNVVYDPVSRTVIHLPYKSYWSCTSQSPVIYCSRTEPRFCAMEVRTYYCCADWYIPLVDIFSEWSCYSDEYMPRFRNPVIIDQ